MYIYLITGGAGFIGFNFVKYLLQKYDDIKVIVLDNLTYAGNFRTIEPSLKDSRLFFVKGNIVDTKIVNEIFEKNLINFIVNFAAETHVDKSIINPKIFFDTNTLGTQNLLEVAKKYWTIGEDAKGYPVYKKFVKYLQISTDEVYGSVLGEDICFSENDPLVPRNPYSASKASADLIVQAYNNTYKIPINITRSSNNYGPYQFPEKLIPLIIKNILEKKQITIYGDGQNIRDWIYVKDHCKAIDLVLHNAKIGEIYNIGGLNEKKNIDVVKLIIFNIKNLLREKNQCQKLLNLSLEYPLEWINENLVSFVRDRLGHDKRYSLNSIKIMTDLGWYPEMQFKKGILETIWWYLNNQSWVKEVTIEKFL